jgi:hypothetical protein
VFTLITSFMVMRPNDSRRVIIEFTAGSHVRVDSKSALAPELASHSPEVASGPHLYLEGFKSATSSPS